MSHETRTSPPTYPEILDIHDGAFSESIWGSDGFRTIKISGQADVVADSYKDDLTITAGTNVTITTNASGDAVTISSTPYTAGNGLQLSGNEFAVTALAITSVQEAANESAHLALTTQQGDVVVRADENKSYVRNAGTAGNMSDFTLLKTPTDLVLSVHGNTGAITANQIAAAVEAATDSNTFTDADHSKLNAIEASATADQTSGEIKSLLAGDNITGAHIADDAIDSEHYANLSIDTGHIADGQITTRTIGASQVTDDEIAANAVTESKILNDAVTYAKIQNVSATDRILGRSSSGAGVIEEVTPVDIRSMLQVGLGADATTSVSVNAAGAVMHTDIDGKGELLVGDGSGDAGILTAGTDNHILTADSNEATGLKWRAENAHTDKVNQNAFSIVAVSGQDNIVADAAQDTVTFAAGTNVTLTTTAGSDTVTIAAADTSKMPLAGGTFTGDVKINDGEEIRVGSDSDLIIVHDGSNGFIKETTGTLDIRAKNTNGGIVTISDSAGENLIKCTAGSSVELTYDGTKKFETTTAGATVTGVLTATLADNSIDSDHYVDGSIDLAHMSANSVDSDQYVDGSIDLAHMSANSVDSDQYVDGSIDLIHMSANSIDSDQYVDGSIDLVHLSASGTKSSSTYLRGDNTWASSTSAGLSNVVEDTSPQLGGDLDTNSFEISLDDSHAVKFGDGNDLQISHDGSHSYIDHSGTGQLRITSNNNIWIQHNAENMIVCNGDGAVELYYDNAKKLDTKSNGINVTGNVDITGSLGLPDSEKVVLGAGSDLQIYHDGSNSYIKDAGTGRLKIITNHLDVKNAAENESIIQAAENAAVELYFDNSKKFNTTSDGGTLTGNLFVSEALQLNDSKKIELGNSADLEVYHTGSHGYIDCDTGNLLIRANVGSDVGGNIYLRPHDDEHGIQIIHDGGVELYYDSVKKFETHTNGVHMSGSIYVPDSEIIGFGDTSNPDLRIWHDGSNSNIQNNTNDLFIRSNSSGDHGVVVRSGASVDLCYDNSKKFETTSAGCHVTGNITVSSTGQFYGYDNAKVVLGHGSDLQIYHDGSHSYIKDSGTGHLLINTSELGVMNAAGNEDMIKATENGAVELYYDGVIKLQTRSSDVWCRDDLIFADSDKIKLGDGNDLQIYHNGSNSLIHNSTGNLFIQAGGGHAYIQAVDDENGVKVYPNGQVELFYDDSKKFFTHSAGCQIDGNLSMTNADGYELRFGLSNDLKIYHDGSNSRINDSGTGSLVLQTSNLAVNNAASDEEMIKAAQNGQVELFYDNSKKLETTSGGVSITGALLPAANDTHDLGSSSYAWNNLYVNDLHFSNNPDNPNSVDGTWGDWTLQEGENDIFMLNNRSGKKYKMNLTEVS